ncbi:MAG: thiamine diphosphokinase [Anaerolineaceae bacterium]|nr:thiamine diphosphokinase [Anaerolineaceae bacterium]
MLKDNQRVILFVNGDLPDPEKLRARLTPEDILIAVDGGLRHIVALGLTPDLILGDLDSANPENVHKFEAQGIPVRRYPIAKDETDLELGILAALEHHPQAIWIVAAVGGRLDQTLGNIFLLTQPNLAELDVRLMDGAQEVFLIRDHATLTGQPGQTVSLLPLMGPAPGVTTDQLAYPLNHETLYPDRTRGISNIMTAATATVTIDNGILLCIHTFNTTNH